MVPDAVVTEVEEHGVVRVEGGVLEHLQGELLKLVVLKLQLRQVGDVK